MALGNTWDRSPPASPTRFTATQNIQTVTREPEGAVLHFEDGRNERFDHVVFACHSDQALSLLGDSTDAECSVLGALPYQSNDVVLHTDVSLLPSSRKAWSSWNYLLAGANQRAVLTYNMNILQGLEAPETFCVTLNHTQAINPAKILGRFTYDHPVFSLDGIAAQQRWQEINQDNTWFCGAYWHNGFHEDGVSSALRVAQGIREIASRAPVMLGSAA